MKSSGRFPSADCTAPAADEPRRPPSCSVEAPRSRAPAPRLRRPDVRRGVIEAVVFDLDGVLVDSEQLWDEAREELARERGGRWHEQAQRDMMGMSSPEWSRYMHEAIGLPESPEEINREVVARMLDRYADAPPWVPGAIEAVRRLAGPRP